MLLSIPVQHYDTFTLHVPLCSCTLGGPERGFAWQRCTIHEASCRCLPQVEVKSLVRDRQGLWVSVQVLTVIIYPLVRISVMWKKSTEDFWDQGLGKSSFEKIFVKLSAQILDTVNASFANKMGGGGGEGSRFILKSQGSKLTFQRMNARRTHSPLSKEHDSLTSVFFLQETHWWSLMQPVLLTLYVPILPYLTYGNHPFLWRRIRRVRRIQVCMARKGLTIWRPIFHFRLILSFEKEWSIRQRVIKDTHNLDV